MVFLVILNAIYLLSQLGSRQQSRFIAMMDDYKRTMELVGIANNAAGASTTQFNKTLDSVEAKANQIKANFESIIGNFNQ